MIEFGVSEQEQMLLEAAERFAKERLKPAERQTEKERAYSQAVAKEYDELGFSRMGLAESEGGLALPLQTRMQALAQIAGGDPAAPFGLDPWGPATTFLASFPAGKELLKTASHGFVVYGDGLQVSATECNGTVAWVPKKQVDWLLIVQPQGVALVSKPPFKAIEQRGCGLHAAGGVEITLKKTPCKMVGDTQAAQLLLNEARIFASAAMLGAAKDALNYANRYSQERIAFGKPIAHHQGLAFMLVECASDLDGAMLLMEVAAGRVDRMAEVANAYALASSTAHRVAERCVQALGGHGYLYDHPVEKRMRDIRAIASLFGGAIHAETDAAEHILEMREPVEVEA